MNNSKRFLKLVVLAMLIALGVVISPILRVEGMCPMAHFINIICSVFLGPWYSLLCATAIGIIRMLFLGIPPLALTGAIFGAFLSGVLYRASNGKIIFAVLGEIIGTGIIGAIISYPIMAFVMGKTGITWLFYVPSFTFATIIGGSIAFIFLKKLSKNGMLKKIQMLIADKSYDDNSGIILNTATIAAIGVILYLVIKVLVNVLKLTSPVWNYLSIVVIIGFAVAAVIYHIVNKLKRSNNKWLKKLTK